MIPQMKARGYGADYAVNVTSMAALIALLLPPSHNMIIYSISGGGKISIADLFTAGIIPGLLLALALSITAWIVAVRRGYPTEPFPGFRRAGELLLNAVPGLLLIAIIFGGVRSGVFTATESSCVAVLYALLVTFFVYRTLSWREFMHATQQAVRTTSMVLLIIGMAGAFGWLMAYLKVAQMTVDLMGAISQNPYTILLMINIVLLVLGTFMDMAPLIIITTPIFLPVVHELRHRPGALRRHHDPEPRHRPQHPAARPGAVRRRRRRQDHHLGGDEVDLAVLRRRPRRAAASSPTSRRVSLWLPSLFH